MQRAKREDFPYFSTDKIGVPLEELVPGCPKPDCIPSLDNPKWIGAEQAEREYLPSDQFIAIIYQKEVYAAPLKILNLHEIINFSAEDNTPLAITFCPLCQTETGYIRKLHTGDIVELGVSGLLWNSALVLYDRKTLSLFSQVLSKGIVGKHLDMPIPKLPVIQSSLSNLVSTFPDIKILDRNTGSDRAKYYDREVYGNYLASDKLMFPVKHQDTKLHPKELVHSFNHNGQRIIVPHSRFKNKSGCIKLADGIYALMLNDFPLFFSEPMTGLHLPLPLDKWIESDFSFYFVCRAYCPSAIIVDWLS